MNLLHTAQIQPGQHWKKETTNRRKKKKRGKLLEQKVQKEKLGGRSTQARAEARK